MNKTDKTTDGAAPLDLPVRPYAVQLFADLERGQVFETLLFRHKRAGDRNTQLALIPAVLDGLSNAGLAITGSLEARVTLEAAPKEDSEEKEGGEEGAALSRALYRVHVSVPVRPPSGDPAALVEALRARYRGAGR